MQQALTAGQGILDAASAQQVLTYGAVQQTWCAFEAAISADGERLVMLKACKRPQYLARVRKQPRPSLDIGLVQQMNRHKQ